jgi:5'-AMP-activated protein kinase regulatory gamma subunit
MSGADTATSHTPLDASAFVAPRNLLARPTLPAADKEQIESLRTIRAFLKSRTSYDVLPISYRLIVLDTALLVKKSLNILNQNGERARRKRWTRRRNVYCCDQG